MVINLFSGFLDSVIKIFTGNFNKGMSYVAFKMVRMVTGVRAKLQPEKS